jgi:hypothetical protein
MTIRLTAMVALALAFGSHADPVAADAPCDGAYRSWGRACFGGAFVRNKTIEWNATFSACKPSPYEVVDSDLKGETRRVAYRFKKRSKFCRYEVMEIAGEPGGSWSIVGYPTLEAYQKRDNLDWIWADDKTGEGRWSDSCPIKLPDPVPSERCNLDFARKKK